MPPAAQTIVAPLRRMLGVMGDFALPPRCPACGEPVGADGRFCAGCWAKLRFLGPPWCSGCHVPFAFDRDDARCPACRVRPPRHGGIDAAVAYGDVARQLALKLKYGGRMGVARTMAALMARRLPADADVLVPVSLHRWRLWSRGYNQAGLIAAALSRRTGVPVTIDALHRTRRTAVLRGLSGNERRRAVAGAFAVAPQARASLAGAHVVLVDDVHTSGATADAATEALLAAGAASVSVLCWARVIDGAGD